MVAGHVAVWKNAPFIRFLLPLMTGILLQWHLQFAVHFAWYTVGFSVVILFLSFFLSQFRRFQLSSVSGIAVTGIFLAVGSLLAWYKDMRHDPDWLGRHYKPTDFVTAVLKEPLVEKENSYKVFAAATSIAESKQEIRVRGRIVIYFKKDATLSSLDFGSQIIFRNTLQRITNAGNPGGFDYERYCLFQDVTHQVYLKPGEFVVLKEKKSTIFEKILFPIRRKILSILRRYIRSEREQGLAEALLIGYKDDLDKNLVQSYTNTGVVHVIAISGLHLGLIYWLLVQMFRPFNHKRVLKWFVPLIIISSLWLFSLIAGGQPSVLRSAVMFTCIVLAKSFSRKTSIYNSLAFSAFLLLCINPYWLWDVGFQLSYAALLSIVIFMRPIYNWFYIKNKALDLIWKLSAVSISAQLLTTPFSIYHFHQFPNYFVLTNIVAVPLSSAIVLGELFLCGFSVIPSVATISGKILTWLIWVMNSYIERIESLPYSLWDGMQINITQAALLIVVVIGFAHWLMGKQKNGVWVGAIGSFFFVSLRSISFYRSEQQHKFIVYNIPKHRAIDVINGRDYFFISDSDLLVDDFVRSFYLKPSRVLNRVHSSRQLLNSLWQGNFLQFGTKRILLVDHDLEIESCSSKISIDVLVISKTPKLHLLQLSKTFNIRQVVFDGSVSPRKIKYWINDCALLRIPYHNVNEKGAFVIKLN